MTNTLQKNTKKESKVKGIAGRKENHTLTYIVLVIFTLIYILPILWMTIFLFQIGHRAFQLSAQAAAFPFHAGKLH